MTQSKALALTIALSLAGSTLFVGTSSAHPTPVTPTPAAVAPAVTPPPSTAADTPMVEADVRALMVAKGFTEINDVKFTEGVWTADGKSADGNHVEVKVDSVTGRVYADDEVATVTEEAVIASVLAAGYTNVHDVEFEGGVWKAEANDSKGNDVELKLDPTDARILGSENDAIGGNKP